MSSNDSSSDAVRVICRVRPFSKREIDIHLETHATDEPIRPILVMEDNDTIFLDPETYVERERFAFDLSLWSVSEDTTDGTFATQEVVMESIGLPAVAHVWSGYNVSMFAYGQTGSGKTYTMMGSDEEPGLIPRLCQELFRTLEQKRADDSGRQTIEGTVKEYRLEARFLEIYNEKVKDLLWEIRDPADQEEGIDHENLRVRHIPNMGPIIVGLTSIAVNCWADCLRLIEEGTRHRSVAATKMNATSSRSHSIFRLNFVQVTTILPKGPYEKPKSFENSSNVCLVDLAGSERNKKTGAQGDRLKEAVAINKSLTTLKNVIDALVEGRQVIPYRDSQLTLLLSESLGGNSKTFMIACASPHSDNADETLNTLRYALRAQGIACHATVNESEELRKMNQMRQELEQLRQLKEDPQDQLTTELRRASEGKREQLASMQSVSAQQEELQQQLQNSASLGSELRQNSKYQMAFRVLLARRVEKAAEALVQQQNNDAECLKTQIREAERQLSAITSKRTSAAKSETDARILFKAREKELDSLKSRNSALEWRKRTLMKQDEQLRLAAERKMNMKPRVTLVTKCLVAYQLLGHQKKLAALAESMEECISQSAAQESRQEEAQRAKQAQLLGDAKDEVSRVRSELSAARAKMQRTQQSFQKKIQALHAECIFLETEIKEMTELHEKSVAGLNKNKAASFFSAKEEWSSKLQRYSFERQQELSALSSEIQVHLSNITSRDAKELQRIESESLDALKALLQTSEKSVDALDKAQQASDEKIEALNRESLAYLSAYRHSEQRYRVVYERLRPPTQVSPTDVQLLYSLLTEPKTKSATSAQLAELLKSTSLPAKSAPQTPSRPVSAGPTTAGPAHRDMFVQIPRARSPALGGRRI